MILHIGVISDWWRKAYLKYGILGFSLGMRRIS
jgi:hypothetical protein